jgi:DNA-binding NarL/FixJ family response regulator
MGGLKILVVMVDDCPEKHETSHHGRVLVVEDEVILRLLVEQVLREAGFTIVGLTGSASEAIETAIKTKPDIILMDIRLAGGSDGVAAAIEIYKQTGIRCVFVTAHHDDHTKQRASAARPLGWIPKPYQIEDLPGAISAALSAGAA